MDLPLLQSLVLKRKISPLRKVSQREGTILLFFVVERLHGGRMATWGEFNRNT